MRKLSISSALLLIAALVVVPLGSVGASHADGAFAYWSFDEGTGTVVADLAHDNDVSLVGDAAYSSVDAPVPGSDYALLLDGDGDYAEATSATLPIGGAARTISAWIYPDSTDADGGTLVSWGDGSLGSAQQFMVQRTVAGPTWLFTDGVNGDNNVSISGAQIPPADTWSHVAFVMESDGDWFYYLNGAEAGTGTFATAIDTSAADYLRIGERSDYPNPYGQSAFKGMIDEVRIYGTALDADAIGALFDYGTADVSLNPTVTKLGPFTATATLDPPLSGIPVLMYVTGANTVAATSVSTDGDGEALLPYTGTNLGADTITACIDMDASGTCDVTEPMDTATNYWVSQLSLTPATDVNPIGSSHTVTADLDGDVLGVDIHFSVTGANATSGTVATDAFGTAQFTYTGAYQGADTISAWADLDDNGSSGAADVNATDVSKEWYDHAVKVSGNAGPFVKGSSRTWGFEGFVSNAGSDGLYGSITVNYRARKQSCTFTPTATSTFVLRDGGVTPAVNPAEIADLGDPGAPAGLWANSCGGTAWINLLDQGYGSEIGWDRGGIWISASNSDYDIKSATATQWVQLMTGNVHVIDLTP